MKPFIGCILFIVLLVGCGGEGFYVKKYSEEYAREHLVPVAPGKTYANAKERATEAYDRVEIISVSEYDQLVESGKPHLLLDIRETKEFEAGAYANAINLPRGVLEFKIFDSEKWESVNTTRSIPLKKEPIIIYCRSGLRSALVADNLQRLGFSDLKIIRGGWEQQKKGIEAPGSQPIERKQPPEKIVGQFESSTAMVAAAKKHCTAITVGQLESYLAETPNVYLFDLRQPEEFSEGHIAEAILSPRGVFEFQMSLQSKWDKVATERSMPAKNAPIVIYCKKGSRSVLAADVLRSLGFTNVLYLEGGWEQYLKGPEVVVDDGGCG